MKRSNGNRLRLDGRLLVMGHSIPHDDKKAIVDEMRQHCSAPVLALLRTNEPELTIANQSVEASRPDLLLAAVESLMQRPPSAD
jgi:hypothetical protein